MQILRKLLTLFVALTLSALWHGCSIRRPVAAHAVNYNLAVEKAHNQIMLLNVIRASKHYPQHFSTLKSINGTATAGLTPSLTLPFGEHHSATQALGLGFSASRGAAVAQVEVLESKEFMQGMLTPVPLGQIEYFVSQGWDQPLLYMLFLEQVEVRGEPAVEGIRKLVEREIDAIDPKLLDDRICAEGSPASGPRCIFDNKPSSDLKMVRAFEAALQAVLKAGAIEVATVGTEIGPPLKVDKLPDISSFLDPLRAGTIQLEGAPDNQVQIKAPSKVLCVRLADTTYTAQVSGEAVASGCSTTGNGGAGEVIITLRSVEGILFYLGELVEAQAEAGRVVEVRVPDSEALDCDHPGVRGCRVPKAIFVVDEHPRNLRNQRSLVEVRHEGSTYLIPRRCEHCSAANPEGHHLSMPVLSLLQQLVGLNRTSAAEPGAGQVVIGVGPTLLR